MNYSTNLNRTVIAGTAFSSALSGQPVTQRIETQLHMAASASNANFQGGQRQVCVPCSIPPISSQLTKIFGICVAIFSAAGTTFK